MSQQFIKLLFPLPDLFQIQMSSDEEPNVFPVIPDRHDIPCPLCQRKTVLHSKSRRRFRHGHARRARPEGPPGPENRVGHRFRVHLSDGPGTLFRGPGTSKCRPGRPDQDGVRSIPVRDPLDAPDHPGDRDEPRLPLVPRARIFGQGAWIVNTKLDSF